jgi:serine/threonine protein phosphatase PrpC
MKYNSLMHCERGNKEKNQDCAYSQDGIYIIADGLSDAPESDMASRMAVNLAVERISQSIATQNGNPLDHVRASMKYAARRIYTWNLVPDAQGIPQVANKGRTTLDIGLIRNHNLYFTHMGDSRIYAFKENGRIEKITPDDSNERGELELYLGKASDDVRFWKGTLPLYNCKMLYFATDGAYKFVSDAEVEGFLNEEISLKEKMEKIIQRAKHPVAKAEELANRRNIPPERARADLMRKRDDITVILVDWTNEPVQQGV